MRIGKVVVAVLAFLAVAWLGRCAAARAQSPAGAGAGTFAEGVRLFEKRQFAEAKTVFESLAKQEPANSEVLHYLGRAELARGNHEQAIPWLERAVSLSPSKSDYHVSLGSAYGRKAQKASLFSKMSWAKKSRGELEKAVELDPNNLRARSALMEYYLLAPGIVGGGIDKARRQASEIARRDRFDGHRATGRIFEQEKKHAEAEQEYLKAAQMKPADPRPHAWLGALHASRKDYDKAQAEYGKVIAMQPNSEDPLVAVAHYRLGAIYEQQGNRDAARREYREVLRTQPDFKEAKEALGRVSRD